jgi:hypothetical protein
VHYKNDIPSLRSCNSSRSDNRNGSGNLMVIDATNINCLMGMAFKNDPCVNTCDASIGTLIDENFSFWERLVPGTYTFASLLTKQCLQLYLARSSGGEHDRHLGSMLCGSTMLGEQSPIVFCLSIQQKMPGQV